MHSLHIDNIHLIKKMNIIYSDAFESFKNVLVKENLSDEQKNVIANIAMNDLLEAQQNQKNPDVVLNPNRKYRTYLSHITSSQKYKDTKKQIANQDNEKIIISGIWLVFSFCIILMFLKSLLTQNYLINFSIDLICAVIALLIGYKNYLVRYRIINRYQLKKYILYDCACLILCIISKIIGTGNFDVSYLILVIDYFITKKKIIEEIKKAF